MIELSKAEFDVLDALWINYPATASQIIERLSDDKQWHEKTIKTLLGRLVKKGALTFEKEGRQYIYMPCMERADYTLKESQNFIERFFSGRIAPLVSGFAKSEQLS
ncbi:BlaI/MecI/CopY family transcriptional regulator, partial [Pseudoalteromonas sp. Z1A6]